MSSVFLLLNEGELGRRPEFHAIREAEKRAERSPSTGYKLFGETIECRHGRWMAKISDDIREVPIAFKDFVTSISLHDGIPGHPYRARGIYRYNQSTAELEHHSSSDGEGWYTVEIEGLNLSDSYHLLQLIKAGAIQPELSYEDDQIDTNELTRIRGELMAMRKWLKDSFNPICLKASIEKEIHLILTPSK